ncbi:MAG: hypothetical protein COB69_10685, partial [Phycisphaera sp.]
APVAAAQTELCLLFSTTNGTDWTLTAELLNPTQTVLATISDLGFTMFGTNIANFEYNPAFDSDFFGPATVITTPSSVDFQGTNTLPPLANAGGVDSSNPLFIASFTADNIPQHPLVLNGQVTGAYVGVPFPIVFFYQYPFGSDIPWSVKVIPAPSSIALLGLAGFVGRRRR